MTISLPTPCLLDGAIGTEIARRGFDVERPSWSALAAIEAPEVLVAVHEDYLRAGADIITANTFRTSRFALQRAAADEHAIDHLDARELTQRTVALACAVRDRVRLDALVIGSVAPLGDCYKPQLTPDEEICRCEHAAHIDSLFDAGVDGILIESMPTVREATVAARCAHDRAPGRWMISCLVGDADWPGHLIGGDSMQPLMANCESTLAIGVNCVAAPDALAHVRWLSQHVPAGVRISVYANTSRLTVDQHGQTHWTPTDANDPHRYAQYAMTWADAGASIIGGCCGTTPETIAAIRSSPDEAFGIRQ